MLLGLAAFGVAVVAAAAAIIAFMLPSSVSKIVRYALGTAGIVALIFFSILGFRSFSDLEPMSTVTPDVEATVQAAISATLGSQNVGSTKDTNTEATSTDILAPTATDLPAQVQTPTFTPTHMPQPSPTPTSTSTPIPDTVPGTILKVGDTWRQNGMTMRVEKFGIEDSSCGDVFNTLRLWGTWQVVIENHTGQDLVVNMDHDDFFLVDNSGRYAGTQNKDFGYMINLGKCVEWLDIGVLKSGQELRLNGWGVGGISEQEWFRFGATKVGRIENAVWQLDIPR